MRQGLELPVVGAEHTHGLQLDADGLVDLLAAAVVGETIMVFSGLAA